jgi:VIT1/CCC1 family predicted Fe2+/Mn2+ transporter
LIPGSGIFQDIKRRLPFYFSDYYQGIHPKILFSTFFMFFTSIAPALAFGFLLDLKTNQAIGVVEVLFSTALCGIIYAIISGQPMVCTLSLKF